VSLIRILVDGYSLLHEWTELAPGKPRHSAAAREALIQRLMHYQDAVGTPVTVFFDGSGAPPGTPKAPGTPHMEVLFSGKGQTADDMIERAAYRFQEYGEVLAVTNDSAERNLVVHMGGLAESCANFIHTVDATLSGLAEDVERHNREERRRYRQSAGRSRQAQGASRK
jgi:predicted RNA-binding protein with PIN domain